MQVTLTPSPTEAMLVVADTGPGSPASQLPLIFDRFHRVDSSMSRRHSGSGIGLALVKELVALLHGTVAVASTEGMGTTFTVCLPLGTAHLQADELLPPATYPQFFTAGLLLEEEPIISTTTEDEDDTRPLTGRGRPRRYAGLPGRLPARRVSGVHRR